jgi:predicted nucleic acid-binding protein
VDSSYYYAVAAEQDPNHAEALAIASETDIGLCTNRYVLAETMSLLTKRASKSTALRVAWAFILSPEACLLDVTTENFDAAWALFSKYPDWDFDLVDAISFALMKREEIDTALTFDRHFAQIGFEVLPG